MSKGQHQQHSALVKHIYLTIVCSRSMDEEAAAIKAASAKMTPAAAKYVFYSFKIQIIKMLQCVLIICCVCLYYRKAKSPKTAAKSQTTRDVPPRKFRTEAEIIAGKLTKIKCRLLTFLEK